MPSPMYTKDIRCRLCRPTQDPDADLQLRGGRSDQRTTRHPHHVNRRRPGQASGLRLCDTHPCRFFGD